MTTGAAAAAVKHNIQQGGGLRRQQQQQQQQQPSSFEELLWLLGREYSNLSKHCETLKVENERLQGISRGTSGTSIQGAGAFVSLHEEEESDSVGIGEINDPTSSTNEPTPGAPPPTAKPSGFLSSCCSSGAEQEDSASIAMTLEKVVALPASSEGRRQEEESEDNHDDEENWLAFSPDDLIAGRRRRRRSLTGGGGSNNNMSPRSSARNWEVVGSHPLPRLPRSSRSLGSNGFEAPVFQTQASVASIHEILELQPIWTEAVEKPQLQAKLMRSKTFASSFHMKVSKSTNRGGDALIDRETIFQECVLGPNSRPRLLWDALSVFVLAIDILTVPLTVFAISEEPAVEIIGLGCTIFWTVDILASLISGFHTPDGLIEMRPRKIWKNYLRGWFLFDVTVIGVDWGMLLLDTGFADLIGIVRLGKVARVTRIFRLFRLLRMLKMPVKTEDISDNLHSEGLYTTFGVLRSLAMIVLVNHFIACGWYGVGTWGSPGWVQEFEATLDTEPTIMYSYTTALHWSFAQFTPAPMSIQPTTVVERGYAILVLLGGLVVFSSFVSSITAALTQLHQVNKQATKQAENIRKYIHDNKLSLELGNRIVSFGRRHRNSARRRVHENEIEIFQVLPQSLRLQVHWEVYSPILSTHPVFFNFAEVGDACLLEICNTAMAEHSLSTSQELFTYGQTAVHMSFILSGELEYFHQTQDLTYATLIKGNWCSEATLWLKWEHQGRLVAMGHCEFALLNASSFRRVIAEWFEIHKVCMAYAQTFRAYVEKLGPNAPIDVFHLDDEDEVREMVLECFDRYFEHVPKVPVGLAKAGWRPWHSVSLMRLKTPPLELKRSHSLP